MIKYSLFDILDSWWYQVDSGNLMFEIFEPTKLLLIEHTVCCIQLDRRFKSNCTYPGFCTKLRLTDNKIWRETNAYKPSNSIHQKRGILQIWPSIILPDVKFAVNKLSTLWSFFSLRRFLKRTTWTYCRTECWINNLIKS